jgi:hypothetical protein
MLISNEINHQCGVNMADVTQGVAGINDIVEKIQSGSANSVLNGLDVGSLVGSMNMTNIVISILAGLIGSGFFMYGKKRQNLRILGFGIALCVVPYFISNTLLLLAACIAMTAAPFVMEHYA